MWGVGGGSPDVPQPCCMGGGTSPSPGMTPFVPLNCDVDAGGGLWDGVPQMRDPPRVLLKGQGLLKAVSPVSPVSPIPPPHPHFAFWGAEHWNKAVGEERAGAICAGSPPPGTPNLSAAPFRVAPAPSEASLWGRGVGASVGILTPSLGFPLCPQNPRGFGGRLAAPVLRGDVGTTGAVGSRNNSG